jgi:HD-like signal output (HDOD) protein
MLNIDRISSSIREFPTLPTIYSKIMDVIANPRSTANDLAKIISDDQSAASKILKVSNSSFYGFQGKITNISKAITFIGFEETKNLVIALSIIDLFKIKSENTDVNPVSLWQQSIAVGVINRIIGQYLYVRNIEDYFLAGILHQIGKLIFLKLIPEEYNKVVRFAKDNSVPVRNAEQSMLGITYTVAGDIISETWKLPIAVKEVIKNHYTGISESEHSSVVAVTGISRLTAMLLGLGFNYDEIVVQPNPEVWNRIPIPKNFFFDNLNRINEDYEQIKSSLLSY